MSADPHRWRRALAASLLAFGTLGGAPLSHAAAATSHHCPVGQSISSQQLPAQARQTLQLIAQGGPFPYDRDGITFGNRERLLPAAQRGYYREYTVRTPGVRHRGARRIVCGGRSKTDTSTCYYSEDHYASFRCIIP